MAGGDSGRAPSRRFHYWATQGAIRFCARLLLGYRATGTEHIPRRGGFLVASSHKSYLDPVLVGASIRRELRYFSKRELFANPVFGWLIRAYGALPVDRGGADRRALQASLQILGDGEGLIVFPEGTRIRRQGLGEAKAGIGLMAIRSGVPVIPVWAGSTWDPRRSFVRRVPVEIRFGAPLRFAAPAGPAESRGAYESAAREVMAAIARLAGTAVPGPESGLDVS